MSVWIAEHACIVTFNETKSVGPTKQLWTFDEHAQLPKLQNLMSKNKLCGILHISVASATVTNQLNVYQQHILSVWLYLQQLVYTMQLQLPYYTAASTWHMHVRQYFNGIPCTALYCLQDFTIIIIVSKETMPAQISSWILTRSLQLLRY